MVNGRCEKILKQENIMNDKRPSLITNGGGIGSIGAGSGDIFADGITKMSETEE